MLAVMKLSTAPDPAPHLYLTSASPRRSDLLHQLRVNHHVLHVPAPPGEDEPQLPGEAPAGYVHRTAHEKAARAVAWVSSQHLPDLPILAADTCVMQDGQVLGKPADRDDAARILRALSGRSHAVHTVVVLAHAGRVQSATSITHVTLRALTDADIARYCDSGEPFGKAGAYAIQGLAGAFVAYIAGSYTGVMGLPLFETAALLREAGILRS